MLLLLKRGKAKVVPDNEGATVREEKVAKEVVVESDLDAEVAEDEVDLDEDLREVQSRKDLKNNLLENLLLPKGKVTGNHWSQ